MIAKEIEVRGQVSVPLPLRQVVLVWYPSEEDHPWRLLARWCARSVSISSDRKPHVTSSLRYTAMKEQQGLGGAMSLSGYLPSSELRATERSKDTPSRIACLPLGPDCSAVLMCHGAADQVVPLKEALLARDRLKSSGYSVRSRRGDGG